MKHESIQMLEYPCEFINITPVNPLISKCEIKVCYVGDTPNRNRSVITKDVAREMANSLPGSPIVGYYNEATKDFEEHNRIIDISGGKVKIKETTKPYGFVDLGAKVWFQKFLDDGENEHEYLMTEGWLWTGAYPEAQRIIDEGNNQSMELSNKFLNATWTKDNNGNPKFFIINEAIIEKLCVLGQNEEPCFEGATITKPQIEFSYSTTFKEEFANMINEIKQFIEGGMPMFTMFAVEIGEELWQALHSYLEATFPRDLRDDDTEGCYRCSKYYIDSIWEEGVQKFVILRDRESGKLYRMNFAYAETGLSSDNELTQVERSYVPVTEEAPVFSLEAIEAYEADKMENFAKEKEEKDKEKEICPECGKPIAECECKEKSNEDEKEKKIKKYSLEEIPEYVELQDKYSALENEINSLKDLNSQLQTQIEELSKFKASIDKKEKQAMIDNFYMLSDEDKQEVVDNIDTYSLEDIEAKLSIICVRKRVSFNPNNEEDTDKPTTYSLNSENNGGADFVPAWIKSVQSTAKEINNN